MDIEWIITQVAIYVLWGSCVILTFGILIDVMFESAADTKCQSIGMSSYKNIMDTDACIDHFGNAHFVDTECEGWAWNKVCTTKVITVGEVRIQ